MTLKKTVKRLAPFAFALVCLICAFSVHSYAMLAIRDETGFRYYEPSVTDAFGNAVTTGAQSDGLRETLVTVGVPVAVFVAVLIPAAVLLLHFRRKKKKSGDLPDSDKKHPGRKPHKTKADRRKQKK